MGRCLGRNDLARFFRPGRFYSAWRRTGAVLDDVWECNILAADVSKCKGRVFEYQDWGSRVDLLDYYLPCKRNWNKRCGNKYALKGKSTYLRLRFKCITYLPSVHTYPIIQSAKIQLPSMSSVAIIQATSTTHAYIRREDSSPQLTNRMGHTMRPLKRSLYTQLGSLGGASVIQRVLFAL